MKTSEIINHLESETYTLLRMVLEARREDWEADNLVAVMREVDARTAGRHRLTQALVAAREAHGLSQTKVAEAIGVTDWRYGVMERDPGLIPADEFMRICEVLGVDPNVLLAPGDAGYNDAMHEAIMDARGAQLA